MDNERQRNNERHVERERQLIEDSPWPIGSEVLVRRDDGTVTKTRTRSAPWLLAGHTAVIKLEGISGGYALERVRLKPPSQGEWRAMKFPCPICNKEKFCITPGFVLALCSNCRGPLYLFRDRQGLRAIRLDEGYSLGVYLGESRLGVVHIDDMISVELTVPGEFCLHLERLAEGAGAVLEQLVIRVEPDPAEVV